MKSAIHHVFRVMITIAHQSLPIPHGSDQRPTYSNTSFDLSVWSHVFLPLCQPDDIIALAIAIRSSSRDFNDTSQRCLFISSMFAFLQPPSLRRIGLLEISRTLRHHATSMANIYRTLAQREIERSEADPSEAKAISIFVDEDTQSRIIRLEDQRDRRQIESNLLNLHARDFDSAASPTSSIWWTHSDAGAVRLKQGDHQQRSIFTDLRRLFDNEGERDSDSLPMFNANSWQQLMSGLILTKGIREALIHASTFNIGEHESPTHVVMSIPPPLTFFVPTLAILHLRTAITRLLSVYRMLNSNNCIFSFARSDGGIHPFIIRWPTNEFEMKATIKRYLPQYAKKDTTVAKLEFQLQQQMAEEMHIHTVEGSTHELLSAAATTSTTSSSSPSQVQFVPTGDVCHSSVSASSLPCGGELNPDAMLISDIDLEAAMHRSIDPENGVFHPDEAHFRSKDHVWTCDKDWSCPSEPSPCLHPSDYTCPAHDHLPPLRYDPTEHMQLLRGCLWWHCDRATHLVREIACKELGVSVGHWIQSGLARPGCMEDWRYYFFSRERSNLSQQNWDDMYVPPPPPLYGELIDRRHAEPRLPNELNTALGATFPWSISLSVVDYYTLERSPGPALVMSPLAPGWVGGFISSANPVHSGDSRTRFD